MSFKVALISLGCAKNLVNSEQMLCLLADAGFEIAAEAEGADAAIVNTCGFIDSAKMEAIENILSLGELKNNGRLKKIIVTGCLSERYRTELLEEMPEIDAVVGTGSYGEIVNILNTVMTQDESVEAYGDIDAPVDEIGRIISTGSSWAYIKIAEGCDNRCSYCVIPSLRGKFRSRPMENILEEAKALAQMGIKELIVVAQDITRYGIDIYGEVSLAKLLEELCKIDGFQWIRLHYLYPDEITDELIEVIAANDKILKYLDIPIQHINDKILKLMNRRGTGEEIRVLFKKLREKMPDIVLRTSLITGLPGEGEDEFEELCTFLKEAKIQRAGVFPYSPEEGTPAAEMDRVDEDTSARRAELVMDIQYGIMAEFNESRLGKTEKVLCEGFDEELELYYGRSYAESPDIDGRVLFIGTDVEFDKFYDVLIEDEIDGELFGKVKI